MRIIGKQYSPFFTACCAENIPHFEPRQIALTLQPRRKGKFRAPKGLGGGPASPLWSGILLDLAALTWNDAVPAWTPPLFRLSGPYRAASNEKP